MRGKRDRLVQCLWALVSVLLAEHVSLAAPPVLHPNQVIAWSGLVRGPVLHDNSSHAWLGVPGGEVRHSSGQLAWSGFRGSSVYHANGAVAWQGVPGGFCYASSGEVVNRVCDHVVLPIGPGIILSVSRDDAQLIVYKVPLRIANWPAPKPKRP